jgi:hypothetical protein
VVLADGIQTAFAAGVVAELARRGHGWRHAFGAGLGAHVAALAAAGGAHEAEERWQAQADVGCPLMTARVAGAQALHPADDGVLVLPDAWRLAGWLDPAALDAFLADAGALPGRLADADASCAVALEDLADGAALWLELAKVAAGDAAAGVRAAATFPGGWGPSAMPGERAALRWGGVEAALRCEPPVANAHSWDVVCGFPVPAVPRPGIAGSIFELVQRRAELASAATLARWLAGCNETRLWAPTAAAYQAWAERDGAELGVEYPLPWERNGELLRGLIGFGRFAASAG